MEASSAEHTLILNELKELLKTINNYLKGKQYLVGNVLTIADIFLTIIQLELQQAVLETNFRNSMANLNNHFKRIIEMPEFIARMGKVKQGKK
mmetsp:Transcript_33047/g.32177  ORF Transcript_33047/g.32177 Transcript_33047/m.32177 type:complete len:93 (+) Transcript_33047:146-424(+)|eukprot:CAMPEP_0170548490 /NCGR_PEP_ID=MMETSP0211-20121228/6809_1 /TAXON_ID=311385 /ORGANISM="Pseudokeronopsis sp., Strain OXSARD2" /LENGTH=92 /DNA_ID=CAMNT_0010854079 /DNA_START=259 /DNA_END=537 /DNA_ORIENTATION=+